MKSYPKYKDSGIQWIGQIPEGWNVVRLNHYCSLKARVGWKGLRSDEFEELSYAYLVTGQDFNGRNINWENCYQINKDRYDEDKYIQLKDGDLLITKDGTIGKIAVVQGIDKPATLNSGIFVLRQKQKTFNQEYLYWLLISPLLKKYNNLETTGASTIQHLYQNVFEKMPLLLPPLSEQESIVRYLDDKTTKIDETVNLLEQQKADLQQYRKALISQTVTRGLHPNAKLKESGISWIGQIPETWKINRIKHFSKIQTGNTPSTAERRYFDGNVNWFTPGDFKGTFVIDNSARKLTQDAVNNNACRIFPANSIYLIGIGGTLGKIAFSEKEASANQQIIVISPNETIISKYIAYFLSTKRNIFELMANAATLPILSNGSVANMDVPIPPLSEQQEIVEYLDTKTAKIDEAIKRIDEQIADLRAYRTALISDVVTGKIDVRN